jgi:cell division transport system ATP-binding protein
MCALALKARFGPGNTGSNAGSSGLTPSILTLNDAAFGYDDKALLSAMTLGLEPGGFYFLTGPSGAGKTTFLRLCYLEQLPTQGTLGLFGRNAAEMTRDDVAQARRRIGVIHQDCRFLDHLDLRENIALPLIVSGKDPQTEAANIDQLLQWVGLGHRADAMPPELSGGERQRAALARAVVMSPELILADEPTGNVDWEMSERLLGLLIELNRMGKTVLVATHDLQLIRSAKARVSTRVLRLKSGEISIAGADL